MRREELEAFGKAMLGMTQDVPKPFSIAMPIGRGRQPESETTRAPRDEEIVLASTSEEALFGAATLLAIQAKAKQTEPKVEEPPPPEKPKSERAVLAEIEENLRHIESGLRVAARRRGIDYDAPPPPPPSPVDDRKQAIDRALAVDRERREDKAARKAQKEREPTGRKIDRLLGPMGGAK